MRTLISFTRRPPIPFVTANTYPQTSRRFACCFLVVVVALALTWCLVPVAVSAAAQQTPDAGARTLESGARLEREMTGGETHVYRIALVAGEFVRVLAEQRGIDVALTFYAPDGARLADVDTPNGTQGPESISLIAEASGNFELRIATVRKNASAGRYLLAIEELRSATKQDAMRVDAERLVWEATQISATRTTESAQQAIAKYSEALPLLRATLDRYGEANALNMIALLYDNALDEKQKAIDFYLQALPLRHNLNDRAGEATTLNGIGRIYDGMGERAKALGYFEQALPLRHAAGDRRGEAYTLSHIGRIYKATNEPQQALGYLSQALQIRRELRDKIEEAINLDDIGQVYLALGEHQAALDRFNQAVALSRAAGDLKSEAFTLINIGKTHQSLGDTDKALDFYNQALALRRRVGDMRGEAHSLNIIGRIYQARGDIPRARENLNQAVVLYRAVGDERGCAATLYNIAHLESTQNNLDEARTGIESALALVESLRRRFTSEQLRASFFASVQEYYELDIDILMRLHRQRPNAGFDAQALQTAERARARNLLELLIEAHADIREGVDPVMLERERNLQQQLAAKSERQSRLLGAKPDTKQLAALTGEIDKLAAEYDQVQAMIRQRSPRYAALTQPAPLAVAAIQSELLDPETALLEYALGGEHSYLWVVTQEGIKSYQLARRAEIERQAKLVYELLTARNERTANESGAAHAARVLKAEASLADAAADLSRAALQPALTDLRNKKRLLVVGDGALQYIPFAALPMLKNASDEGTAIATDGINSKNRQVKRDPTGSPSLIANYEIVNLPSASTLAVLRRETHGRAVGRKAVAVFADPVFDLDDARLAAVRDDGGANTAVARQHTISPPQTQSKPDTRLTPDTQLVARTDTQPNADARNDLRRALRHVRAAGDSESIPRLPFSRREASAIRALSATNASAEWLDFKASRATLDATRLSDFRIVHFATHGLLDNEHPELSGLVLSLVDERGAPVNGFLRFQEIYNLKLPVELVVLSACQTALGREVKGEGMIGFTRGFMYAGARRVAASLWKVDDAATAELMRRFYSAMLRDKLAPAAALRQAQTEMARMERWRAPYYWAGFVLQGEWK